MKESFNTEKKYSFVLLLPSEVFPNGLSLVEYRKREENKFVVVYDRVY